MTEKEIGEIRRRLKREKCVVSYVYGCFVNEKKEIVSDFKIPLGMMPPDDADSLLGVLKKTLSGTVGKNLTDLPFRTEQVVDSNEHRLLSDMRQPGEHSEEAIRFFFECSAASLNMDGAYVILVAQDTYDVPAFRADGERADECADVFRYCIAAVCPLKDTKPALGYFSGENAFRLLPSDKVICPPELGFMFPSFDDRSANVYNVLYYSRKTSSNHPEFIENVLHIDVPMAADEQKETFNGLLASSLEEESSLKVAVAVRDSICEQIAEYKAGPKEEDPPVVTKGSVARILNECGVSSERVEAFEKNYDETFGAGSELIPQTFVNMRGIEVETPDVSIKVNSERSDLIRTKVIDGVHYILIRAENGVEVNGVSVKIN